MASPTLNRYNVESDRSSNHLTFFNESLRSFDVDSDLLRHSNIRVNWRDSRAPEKWSPGVVQFRVQPRLGKDPITSNRHGRDFQDLSDFIMLEAAEIFQFHDVSFS